MAINTYNDLVLQIQQVTEDDGIELAAYIPTAVNLAEQRLFKELDLPDLEAPVTGTLTANNSSLTKPANYRINNYFQITVGGRKTLLKKRTDDFIQDYWPDETVTGIPKYYSDSSSTTFMLAPTPDLGYTYKLKCTVEPTQLAPLNQTNYFVTNCSDILYQAAMKEMAKFQKAWQQVPAWEQEYTNLRDMWNIEMMRKRRDNGETPMNPLGGTNSLKATVKTQA